MNDTIVGISTALGVGAISIIRLSGEDSIKIVNQIFKGKDLTKVQSHTINYGHIVENNEIVDEVLVSVMLSPKTYTKENIVEINCHGGSATTNKIVEILISKRCRPALRGEFTKRAFLNGRIDLVEADGIMNLIEAETENARKLSVNQLSGKVSKLIKDLRNDLIQIVSHIEVNIDYPEYEDIEELTTEKIKPSLIEFNDKISNIINKSEIGKVISNGIDVGIIGRPNVGKSSILNQILEEDKAIVTDIPGTTRDIVEGRVNIGGLILNLIDTAGIRKTEDKVEQIGVDKSFSIIEKSSLVLLVLNNNEKMTEDDKMLLTKIKNKHYLIVINKIDLENKLEIDDPNKVYVCAKDGRGFDELFSKIKEIFNVEKISNQDLNYLSDANAIAKLKEAKEKIETSLSLIEEQAPIDMVELEVKSSWNILGEIIGATYQEEFLDELFSRFCLGK